MNHSSSHNSSFSNNPESNENSENKPLGQILGEAGLISAQQIEMALRDQLLNKPNTKIGEILASHGWIKQETADFFVEHWSQLLAQKQKQPLVYYLREAALLNEKQINDILEERKNSSQKVRFHHVAVQKGLIKRETVDFFLRSLLEPSKAKEVSDTGSFATPYQLLKNYIRGETNFQKSQLNRIKLNNVTLKGVNLDDSNLTGAELKQANLSNSSLKQANLSGANLTKAILKDVDFEMACMVQVSLANAHLEGSSLKQANLSQADLREGYFVNACFFGTDLRKIQFHGANFEGAYYNSATSFDPDFDPDKMGMKFVV